MSDDFGEAVLFRDDSLLIRYTDGGVLQLSPCASVFQMHRAGHQKVQQFSRFAVSSYRTEVEAAIRMRNRIAERPYLCLEFINGNDIVVMYKEIKECTWPISVIPDFVKIGVDGCVHVRSMDGYAVLTLAANRQTFSVHFLALLSAQTSKAQFNKENLKVNSNVSCKQHFQYTWQDHLHSVHDYPDCWHYPVQLALAALSSDSAKMGCSYGHNKTLLPRTLPDMCGLPHLHSWRPCQMIDTVEDVLWQPDLKTLWKDGIMYRALYGSKQGLYLQIHPGDGTVIASTNRTGKFFTLYTVEDKKVKETMISVDKPPPDRPNSKYSIAKLVRLGARLLEFISTVAISQSDSLSLPCWKAKTVVIEQNPGPPMPIEEAVIPGVGRFKAYSNGYLHAVFADRTIVSGQYSALHGMSGSAKNNFSVILPDGTSLVLNTDGADAGLKNHFQMLHQWGEWMNATPEQRQIFYKNTIWDYDATRAVEVEMNKLQRFNYMLDKEKQACYQLSSVSQYMNGLDAGQESLPSGKTIRQALENTSKAIQDIDNLLAHSKRDKKQI